MAIPIGSPLGRIEMEFKIIKLGELKRRDCILNGQMDSVFKQVESILTEYGQDRWQISLCVDDVIGVNRPKDKRIRGIISEFKIVKIRDLELGYDPKLNEFGRQGWQIVTSNQKHLFLIMSRPTDEQVKQIQEDMWRKAMQRQPQK